MRINTFTLIWITTFPWVVIAYMRTVDTPAFEVVMGFVGSVLSIVPFV